LQQNLLSFRILFDSSLIATASSTTAAVWFRAVAMLWGFCLSMRAPLMIRFMNEKCVAQRRFMQFSGHTF
jgi:hypothetical protein